MAEGEAGHTIVHGEIILVEAPTGSRRVFIRFTGDCPDCGAFELLVADHHLRSLRDLLIEAIDLYPNEIGEAGKVVEHYKLAGHPPKDPRAN